jgi:hypothetical protein
MSHAAGDAVLDEIWAWRDNGAVKLQFRLGVGFLRADAEISSESRLPPRYFRIQVASPPPPRSDDTSWEEGLQIDDGTADGAPFVPDEWGPQRPSVFPLGGLSPLGLPEPDTLRFDQWIAVPAANRRSVFTFTVNGVNAPAGDNHFVSVAYPRPIVDGEPLDDVSVTYLTEQTIPLSGDVGRWIAISLDRFYPPGRSSADYIVVVSDDPPEKVLVPQAA